VWTLSAGVLGTVDTGWSDAAVRAARHVSEGWALGPVGRLDIDPVASFGRPRSIVVTADASARYRPADTSNELVRAQLVAGAQHSATEVADARAELERLGGRFRAALGSDLLVLPTLPAAPPRWSEITTVAERLRAIGQMTRLCGPVNSSGLVAVSVPFGHDAAGLPIGVQLVAATEGLVLAGAETLAAR
jgi:amidase